MILKKLVPLKWQRNLARLADLETRLDLAELTADRASQGLARLLLSERRPPNGRLGFEHCEFRIRSQNGEDGILHYLFQKLGTTNRTFVEFGIQSGRECNCAHLALSMGWRGLFLEQDRKFADLAREYYDQRLGERAPEVEIVQARVTPDNISGLIRGRGHAQLDLLAVDIDGNDYWVWKAIDVPARVVVVEYNPIFGGERSITVPCDGKGVGEEWHYHGASLQALAKLGGSKGYALVGCCSAGINAFFVQQSLLRDGVERLSPEEAFRPHAGLIRQMTLDQQWDRVKHLPFVEV